MGYSGAWAALIHEKTHKSKILWHFPFKRWNSLNVWKERHFLYIYDYENVPVSWLLRVAWRESLARATPSSSTTPGSAGQADLYKCLVKSLPDAA